MKVLCLCIILLINLLINKFKKVTGTLYIISTSNNYLTEWTNTRHINKYLYLTYSLSSYPSNCIGSAIFVIHFYKTWYSTTHSHSYISYPRITFYSICPYLLLGLCLLFPPTFIFVTSLVLLIQFSIKHVQTSSVYSLSFYPQLKPNLHYPLYIYFLFYPP